MARWPLVPLMAFVASVAVAGAPAGTGKSVVSWASRPKAPLTAFASMARLGIAFPQRARYVTVFRFAGARHRLILAPLASGDFCTALTGPYGGSSCPSPSLRRPTKLIRTIGENSDASGPIAVDGSFQSAKIARVAIEFSDSARLEVPFVWVGAPIRAAFFYVGVPAPHRLIGHRPRAVLLFDSHGRLVKRSFLPR